MYHQAKHHPEQANMGTWEDALRLTEPQDRKSLHLLFIVEGKPPVHQKQLFGILLEQEHFLTCMIHFFLFFFLFDCYSSQHFLNYFRCL